MIQPRFKLGELVLFDREGPYVINAVKSDGNSFLYCFDGTYWESEESLSPYRENKKRRLFAYSTTLWPEIAVVFYKEEIASNSTTFIRSPEYDIEYN